MAGSLKTAKDTTAMDVSALRWLSTISQGRDLMDNDHDAEGATENEQALLKRIREMKSEGCDAIRLSVCWDTSFYDSRCRSFAPAWLDHIQIVVSPELASSSLPRFHPARMFFTVCQAVSMDSCAPADADSKSKTKVTLVLIVFINNLMYCCWLNNSYKDNLFPPFNHPKKQIK